MVSGRAWAGIVNERHARSSEEPEGRLSPTPIDAQPTSTLERTRVHAIEVRLPIRSYYSDQHLPAHCFAFERRLTDLEMRELRDRMERAALREALAFASERDSGVGTR